MAPTLPQIIAKATPIGIGMVFLFFGQAVLARLVGPAAYGSYGYLITWITVAAILVKSGHDYAIMKTLPTIIVKEEYAKGSFLIFRSFKIMTGEGIIAVSLLGGCVYYLDQIHTDFQFTLLLYAVVAGTVFLISWSQLRRAVMLACGLTWLSEIPDNVARPVLLCTAVFFLLQLDFAPTTELLLAANITVTFVVLVCAAIAALAVLPRALWREGMEPFDLTDVKSVSHTMRIGNVLSIIQRNSDILIIGTLLSPAATGIYIAASRVAAIAGSAVTILDPVVSPRIAAAHVLEDRAELRRIAIEYSLLSSAAAVSFVFAAGLFGETILSLFGPAFVDGQPLVMILLIGHAVNGFSGPSGAFLTMTGQHKAAIRIAFACSVIYLGLLTSLTLSYGATGAAAAYTFGLSIKNIAQAIRVWRSAGINTTLIPFEWLQIRYVK